MKKPRLVLRSLKCRLLIGNYRLKRADPTAYVA